MTSQRITDEQMASLREEVLEIGRAEELIPATPVTLHTPIGYCSLFRNSNKKISSLENAIDTKKQLIMLIESTDSIIGYAKIRRDRDGKYSVSEVTESANKISMDILKAHLNSAAELCWLEAPEVQGVFIWERAPKVSNVFVAMSPKGSRFRPGEYLPEQNFLERFYAHSALVGGIVEPAAPSPLLVHRLSLPSCRRMKRRN